MSEPPANYETVRVPVEQSIFSFVRFYRCDLCGALVDETGASTHRAWHEGTSAATSGDAA